MLLVDRVYQHLLNAGIGRAVSAAGSLPPVWREPIRGIPAPGEGTGNEIGVGAVLGLMEGGGIPNTEIFAASQWRYDVIDVHYRTLKSPDAQRLYIAVRAALVDKRDWSLAGMRVVLSEEARGLDTVSVDAAQGFHKVSAVGFETYTEDWS